VAHDGALVGHVMPNRRRWRFRKAKWQGERLSAGLSLERTPSRPLDDTKKWSKEKENAMRKSLLVPALALGVALSGSAFGHSWSAKMTGQPYSANTPSSKPARSAKMSAQLNSGKSSSSKAVNRV